jgi:hypothetical protein
MTQPGLFADVEPEADPPAPLPSPEWRIRWPGAEPGRLRLVDEAFVRCGACGKDGFKGGACWRCGVRPCSACGRGTGSVLIELCVTCGMQVPDEARPMDAGLLRAIAFMHAEHRAAGRRKKR